MGSGLSRASSRAANAGMNTVRGGMSIAGVGVGTPRRKLTHRPMARRVTMYDDDEGDDGFVADEYEIEMANIRIKVCSLGTLFFLKVDVVKHCVVALPGRRTRNDDSTYHDVQ